MEMANCLHTSCKKEEEEDTMLPGFRFYPTDEELIGFYLRRKVEDKPLLVENFIKHIDIYKYNPWDLPRTDTVGDREWYFFCMRGRKYKNSVRPNRVTGSGFWKATGIDKPVYATENPRECIGLKKSLVYYYGRAGKGMKTDWMMHEFRLPPKGKNGNFPSKRSIMNDDQEPEVWTLCRILRRAPTHSKIYVPERKDKRPDPTKQKIMGTSTDSSSNSCSFGSKYEEHYLNFGSSVIDPRSEGEPVTDEHQYIWSGKRSNSEPYMNFWDVIEDQGFFAEGEYHDLDISYGTSGYHQQMSGLLY
ncbi:hypothetical protein SAY86_023477 [Trapa natans]|uniref:NAC domain-containing protein n=1 Tax=Trapa natans TaxID=22666 RepID=A0AAN7M762_TRANT|nr:hypothetical protein SAY86_023477 [Trapa natans]